MKFLLWRKAIHDFLTPLAALFMAWKALACATDCPTPLVVVTSASMEPTFRVGDVLLLWNRQGDVGVGEVPVLWFPGRRLPMVHRAVETYFTGEEDGGYEQYILTKGDNNAVNDAQLYPGDENFASRRNVMGVVRGVVPLVGWPVIKVNELFSRPTKYVA